MLSHSLALCLSCPLLPPVSSPSSFTPSPLFFLLLYFLDDCDQLALRLAPTGKRERERERHTLLTENNSLRKYIEARERKSFAHLLTAFRTSQVES